MLVMVLVLAEAFACLLAPPAADTAVLLFSEGHLVTVLWASYNGMVLAPNQAARP